SEPTHSFKPVATIRSPEPAPWCCHCNDRVEKTTGLINHVCETLVMRIRQVPLERSRLDGVDRQNGNQNGMAAKRFLIRTDYASPGLLDGVGNLGRST